MKRQFDRREPAGIALLTDVALELAGIDAAIAIAVNTHLDTIEQIHTIGHVLRFRARAQQ